MTLNPSCVQGDAVHRDRNMYVYWSRVPRIQPFTVWNRSTSKIEQFTATLAEAVEYITAKRQATGTAFLSGRNR